MTNAVKKHEFLLPFARLFTREDTDVTDSFSFRSADFFGDEAAPALTAPAAWSNEAVETLAFGAACRAAPTDLRAVEANTVPSWLWHHQNRSPRRQSEDDVRQIIDRAVGSAAARGWKDRLFSSERHARAFYDETRFAFYNRTIAIAPAVMRTWGLAWAYGMTDEEIAGRAPHKNTTSAPVLLANAEIDAWMGKGKNPTAPLWKNLFAAKGKEIVETTVSLSDIAADWNPQPASAARAAIDVMALRHNDGSINIDALRQTARLLTILLDLQDRSDVTIGLVNLSPLLMAFGLAYDSEAGRALAASLAALVTAECFAASAEMASHRGASRLFTANRDATMRALRNHRRAAYGDTNDYEKLSVLPESLVLTSCPDLTLAAEAQRRFDDAVDWAHSFGLRAIQVTDLTPSPELALLMGCASQGGEPLHSLTLLSADNEGGFRTDLHPAVAEALSRLAYPRDTAKVLRTHIAGVKSLRKAPGVNASLLRAKGVSDAAFERIEAYLTSVDSIRFAVTPWMVGIEECRTVLGVPAKKLENPAFDLLAYLGFDSEAVAAADAFVYGHGTLRNAKALHIRHRPIFACGAEIGAEARIRMAAALQSFVSGDAGLAITLPMTDSVANGAEATLAAWRSGVKSLRVAFDPALPARRVAKIVARKIKAASMPHAKPMRAEGRVVRGKKASVIRTPKRAPEKRARG